MAEIYAKGVRDQEADAKRFAAVMANRVPLTPDCTRAQWNAFIEGLFNGILSAPLAQQINRLANIALTLIQIDAGARRFLGEEDRTPAQVAAAAIPTPTL